LIPWWCVLIALSIGAAIGAIVQGMLLRSLRVYGNEEIEPGSLSPAPHSFELLSLSSDRDRNQVAEAAEMELRAARAGTAIRLLDLPPPRALPKPPQNAPDRE